MTLNPRTERLILLAITLLYIPYEHISHLSDGFWPNFRVHCWRDSLLWNQLVQPLDDPLISKIIVIPLTLIWLVLTVRYVGRKIIDLLMALGERYK